MYVEDKESRANSMKSCLRTKKNDCLYQPLSLPPFLNSIILSSSSWGTTPVADRYRRLPSTAPTPHLRPPSPTHPQPPKPNATAKYRAASKSWGFVESLV